MYSEQTNGPTEYFPHTSIAQELTHTSTLGIDDLRVKDERKWHYAQFLTYFLKAVLMS
jgi:hypothetical protein